MVESRQDLSRLVENVPSMHAFVAPPETVGELLAELGRPPSPVLEHVLRELRERKGTSPTVLVTGIGAGVLLEVVSRYLPSAEVHGVDTDLSKWIHGKYVHGVYVHQLDPSEDATARSLARMYDLVVEAADAGRRPRWQLQPLYAFEPYMKKGAMYVFENIDVRGPFRQRLERAAKTMGFGLTLGPDHAILRRPLLGA